ncbi:hypothetical protein Ciccas_002030 [Cichlidogyrus casuarinus]|uniref:Uncharacterized protein n=1 Tax=Cichlidogyrus casuarinus TaxID=1844966 RepID=A0ABD2QIE7_9PLAT
MFVLCFAVLLAGQAPSNIQHTTDTLLAGSPVLQSEAFTGPAGPVSLQIFQSDSDREKPNLDASRQSPSILTVWKRYRSGILGDAQYR